MKYPDTLLFNPTCEYAVANGNKFWRPNNLLQKMEEDLCTLPFLLANSNDILLTRKAIPNSFVNGIELAGLSLPNFKLLSDVPKNNNHTFDSLNRLMPWGWSPATHHLLSSLKPYCSEEFRKSPVANWKPEYKTMYSKSFSLTILKLVLRKLNDDFFLPDDLIPEVCQTKKQIENLLQKWGKLMVKAPWSSSGRGLQPVTKKPVHPKVWEKLLGIVKDQGCVIAEPYLNKVLDMAFQFEIKKGNVEFIGTSFFKTDKKGQYKKNYLNGLPEDTDLQLLNFTQLVEKLTVPTLKKEIESSMIGKYYEGFFGIDVLVFKDTEQNLRVNPCLEINLRQNMGLLALKAGQFILREKKGSLSLFYQQGKSFKKFAEEMQEKNPLILSGGKLESGFLPLTPATEDTAFGAYLLL